MQKFYKIAIIFSSLWLVLTCFIDFMAVPTLFRNITDVYEAGIVGIKIFTFFNYLEVIIGAYLVYYSMVHLKLKLYIILSFLCFIIVSLYCYLLSPMISQLTSELISLVENDPKDLFGSVQVRHDFYHNLYIRLDSLKLFLITVIWVKILRIRVTIKN